MTAVLVLLALVVLRWVLLLFGAALIIRPVRSCPACFRKTVEVRRPLVRLLAGRWFEWRWCPACGWQGPGRRVPRGAGPGGDGGAGAPP